jgi:ABC-type amino acid transport substrate-binding protein
MAACARKEETAAAPTAATAAAPTAATAGAPVVAPAAAPEAAPMSPQAPENEQLTIALEETMKPWTGDLDVMIEKRAIRILTAYSKTFYFVDKGVQRGSSYDMGRLFVEDLNKTLARDKQLKNRNLKMNAVFIPVSRGELIPALIAGKGDIVIASFGVTAEREKLVDFSSPLVPNVSEVVEASRRHAPQPVEGLVLVDERRYGDTVIHRFEHSSGTSSEPSHAAGHDELAGEEETA